MIKTVAVRPFTRRGNLVEPGAVFEVPAEYLPRLATHVAWLEKVELRTLAPIPDLAAVIVALTGDNMNLQRRLLERHCQQFGATHLWSRIEAWKRCVATKERRDGLSREQAEQEAAMEYYLTAWLPELRQHHRAFQTREEMSHV